jgi:putative nucleotidyltransferase with HDIG domain
MEARTSDSGGTWVAMVSALLVAVVLHVPVSAHAEWSGIGTEWVRRDGGSILSILLGFSVFWVIRKRYWPRGRHESHSVRSALFLVVFMAVLFRATLEAWAWGSVQDPRLAGWPLDPWLWTPWFLVTGLASILLGGRPAVLVAAAGALLLYVHADPGPLALLGYLLASVWAVRALRRAPTRGRILKSGLAFAAVLGGVAALDGAWRGGTWDAVALSMAIPLGVGLLSGFVLLAVLPLMEWLLGELSDVTLVEFGVNHPLLDRLKEEAPGTWHHTLNVADLSEKAATAIGARALFCRTASYFHDVGKLRDPALFAENVEGPSPLEDMEPEESARRIIDHVHHGLDLARKHSLPRPFRDVIAEHHGVSVVRFFFAKACERLEPGEDREAVRARFTYPGPPPSTRESGIIALADAVEAATRAMGPQPEEQWRELVQKLIADRWVQGELRCCPLTLAELSRIEDSFVTWLKACHHHRPAYPRSEPRPQEIQGRAGSRIRPTGSVGGTLGASSVENGPRMRLAAKLPGEGMAAGAEESSGELNGASSNGSGRHAPDDAWRQGTPRLALKRETEPAHEANSAEPVGQDLRH